MGSRDFPFMEGYVVKSPFGYEVPFEVLKSEEGIVDAVLPYFSRAVMDGRRSTSISFSIVSFEFGIELPLRRGQRFRGGLFEFVRPFFEMFHSWNEKPILFFRLVAWPLLLCVGVPDVWLLLHKTLLPLRLT